MRIIHLKVPVLCISDRNKSFHACECKYNDSFSEEPSCAVQYHVQCRVSHTDESNVLGCMGWVRRYEHSTFPTSRPPFFSNAGQDGVQKHWGAWKTLQQSPEQFPAGLILSHPPQTWCSSPSVERLWLKYETDGTVHLGWAKERKCVCDHWSDSSSSL